MGFGGINAGKLAADAAKRKEEKEREAQKKATQLYPLPSFKEAVKTAAEVANKGNEWVKDVYGGTISAPKDPVPSSSYYGGSAGQYASPKITPTVQSPTQVAGSAPYSTEIPSWLDTSPLPSVTEVIKANAAAAASSGGIVSGGSSRSSGSTRSSGSSRSSGGASLKTTAPQTFTPTYGSADVGTGADTGWQYQGPQFIDEWSASYRSELANLRDEELALAARLNDQFMRQIDSLIGQYQQYYDQMGQGIDPATEAALAKLREEMTNDQRMIMEYLNARGIAQSGIAAEEIGRLAGTFADKKTEMLAVRLTDLQNQFLTSMENFMDQKIQGMSSHMGNIMGVQERYTTGMQTHLQNQMDRTLEQWKQEQADRASMERAMLPYSQGMTPYEQQSLNVQSQGQRQQAAYQQQQQQQYQQQYERQQATNEAIARLASYPSREAAENSIRQTAAGLSQMGVDIPTLWQALDLYFPVPIAGLEQYFTK